MSRYWSTWHIRVKRRTYVVRNFRLKNQINYNLFRRSTEKNAFKYSFPRLWFWSSFAIEFLKLLFTLLLLSHILWFRFWSPCLWRSLMLAMVTNLTWTLLTQYFISLFQKWKKKPVKSRDRVEVMGVANCQVYVWL